jgi:septum formation protein
MILEKINSYKIFLASNSPRRKQLLSDAGIQFETLTGNKVDESLPKGFPHKDAAEFLAVKKNRAYKEIHSENSILITADTTVLLAGEIMDKPKNKQHAVDILMLLAGNKHEVRTGVCISTPQKEFAFTEVSKVFFAGLSKKEIEYYINRCQPFDKAGAYGIQEWIGHIGIKKIEGSYDNIVGLPVQKVYRELKKIVKQ